MASKQDLPIVSDILLKNFAERYSLSPREAEILTLLANSVSSTSDLSKAMSVSPNTIRNQLQSIFLKTETNSKAELLGHFVRYLLQRYSYDRVISHYPRVLIVDDEEEWCSLVSHYFSCHGVMTETITDPRRVVPLLTEKRFDFVVLDVQMPYVDGWELLVKIKEMKPHPPTVVMVSGFEQEEERVASLEKPTRFFSKPLTLKELLSYIFRCFIDSPFMQTRLVRVEVDNLKVQVDGEGSYPVHELSYQGCFLSMIGSEGRLETMNPGERLNVSLPIPSVEGVLRFTAEVAWKRTTHKLGQPPGIGVHFVQGDEGAFTALREFVQQEKVRELWSRCLPPGTPAAE